MVRAHPAIRSKTAHIRCFFSQRALLQAMRNSLLSRTDSHHNQRKSSYNLFPFRLELYFFSIYFRHFLEYIVYNNSKDNNMLCFERHEVSLCKLKDVAPSLKRQVRPTMPFVYLDITSIQDLYLP